MNAEPLSLRHITRRFDGQLAVDDVSFDVGVGELVALVGASGSGKTTTLRIVAGYETPDAGAVMLGSRDITATRPDAREFGMVFQHYALFPHMSVADNVAFGLQARGVSKRDRVARARAALDAVGLAGKADRRIQSLSGGEQQRVALARAVVIEPRALLLDEPLSNLDPTLRQSTRDELRAMLHRVGAPALFVTHDQEDAFAIADRIVLLAGGRVLQIGAPDDLYDRPVSRAVASFIGRATLVPARDHGATATVIIDGVARDIHVTHPDDEAAPYAEALAVLRPEALTLTQPDAPDAWPGIITARRFAGATAVFQVTLGSGVTVEASAPPARAREGERVGVAVTSRTVPLVPA